VDYLTKPYQNEILISKVRIFLRLYQQNRELHSQSIALSESLLKYKKAEETILLKYQLERAVSLASARFSGNFDPHSSIEFMLLDMAKLCNASLAGFSGFSKSVKPVFISEKHGLDSNLTAPDKNSLQLIKQSLLEHNEGSNTLISYNGLAGPWQQPDNNEVSANAVVTIAIPVNISDSLSGCIILDQCSGLLNWEMQDICSMGVFGTITGNALERSKTRQSLEESESKYRSYIENAPEGILITDTGGRIKETNPAASAIFSISSKDLLKSMIHDLLKPENLAGSFPGFKGLNRCERNNAEFFIKNDKLSKIIRAESVRLPDDQYLVFCTDITAARDFEKHLIHTERMVGIGEMATGIAHEINQPLNTISFGIDNLLHALKNEKADEEYINEKSRKIFEGIHRMRTIIDHVRTFSRSNDDYIPSNLSVNEAIENALSLLQGQFKSHGIELETDLAQDSSVQIMGNTYKIEQVILNLLSNARDAIDEKMLTSPADFTPVISLSTRQEKKHVIITVKDNGKGILAEHMEFITSPFYTTKEPGKGTGLGLAISYGIIKEHKGVIAFASEPGSSTTVTIELPAAAKQSNTTQPPLLNESTNE
ncbi:MAG: PAS domain S-box protein, partial [Lentimicrobium sp.]|nr:PAS domain S-box protein [Lentimicrobium sp.]